MTSSLVVAWISVYTSLTRLNLPDSVPALLAFVLWLKHVRTVPPYSFARTVPSAWNALPPGPHAAGVPSPFGSLSNLISSKSLSWWFYLKLHISHLLIPPPQLLITPYPKNMLICFISLKSSRISQFICCLAYHKSLWGQISYNLVGFYSVLSNSSCVILKKMFQTIKTKASNPLHG